jgi:hypothetical protein
MNPVVQLQGFTPYQHHFIDIPTGALLGVLCVWAWPLERRVALWRAWRWAVDPGRRRLGAAYAMAAACVATAGLLLSGWALWLLWPAISLFTVALNYVALGAHGFQMNRHGRMSWPARWLFRPYRFGAWVNAWLWTRRLPPAQEVMPGIWLGRLPAGAAARGTGARRILSLCAELQAPAAGSSRCVPMLDLVTPTPALLRRAAAALERARDGSGEVLVCCALGFSRSAAVLTYWLVCSGRARTVDEALRLVRTARPAVVLGASWELALAQAAERRPG